jgi:4-hydroxy-3-methylbut-2-en-1-yl diphosphate reductase
MAVVEIDKHSGFCLGVVKAINKAEKYLGENEILYSLGDIVHNNMEVDRLEKKGMQTINYAEFNELKNSAVLLRAHGEPPSTYELAKKRGIKLIDATCPVVLSLQARIRKVYELHKNDDTQIVIFGKSGHAEVVGLLGQTGNTAIVIEEVSEADKLDFSKPVFLFSQTTKSLDEFRLLVSKIKESMQPGISFEFQDTICRQVANRLPHLRDFASHYDRVLFVSGAKSSNGKALYEACLQVNQNTFFITSPDDFRFSMVEGAESIGICGATSTPFWLMEALKNKVEKELSEYK